MKSQSRFSRPLFLVIGSLLVLIIGYNIAIKVITGKLMDATLKNDAVAVRQLLNWHADPNAKVPTHMENTAGDYVGKPLLAVALENLNKEQSAFLRDLQLIYSTRVVFDAGGMQRHVPIRSGVNLNDLMARKKAYSAAEDIVCLLLQHGARPENPETALSPDHATPNYPWCLDSAATALSVKAVNTLLRSTSINRLDPRKETLKFLVVPFWLSQLYPANTNANKLVDENSGKNVSKNTSNNTSKNVGKNNEISGKETMDVQTDTQFADLQAIQEEEYLHEQRQLREIVGILMAHGEHLTLAQAIMLHDPALVQYSLREASREDLNEALGICVEHHDLEMARTLLEHGANANGSVPGTYLSEQDRPTLLASVARGEDVRMLELLIKYGADAARTDLKVPLLCEAATNEHIQVTKTLLAHGAKVNPGTASPLNVAIRWRRKELARYLLAHGADINWHDRDGNPLMAIALRNLPDLVPELLKKGAPVNLPENFKAEFEKRHLFLVPSETLALGNVGTAGLSQSNGSQSIRFDLLTPLEMALLYAPEHEQALKAAGATMGKHKTSLILAALKLGRIQAIPRLLEYGVDINGPDAQGEYALTATMVVAPRLMKTLLEHGANPNCTNFLSRTPLIQASVLNDVDNVRLLLEHGANPNLVAGREHSPLFYARKHNCREIIAMLEKAGAKD